MGVGLGIRSPVEFDLRCVTHFERDPEPVLQHSWLVVLWSGFLQEPPLVCWTSLPMSPLSLVTRPHSSQAHRTWVICLSCHLSLPSTSAIDLFPHLRTFELCTFLYELFFFLHVDLIGIFNSVNFHHEPAADLLLAFLIPLLYFVVQNSILFYIRVLISLSLSKLYASRGQNGGYSFSAENVASSDLHVERS